MLEACRASSLLIGGPKLRGLGVTSALRGEGRTSIALAMTAVQRQDYGRSVVLVDLDFEHPTLARRHDLEPWPGLAELARSEATLDEVMRPLSDGVWLIPAGVIAHSVTREVTEIVKGGLLATIKGEADVVIADLPPLLGGGPGAAAARGFDNLLLVVRAGVTPVARVKEATADLHVAPNVLLNGAYSSLPVWLRRVLGR
jgi:MinD-like ATPase involved in chromosome partitioning or flagellar assembly